MQCSRAQEEGEGESRYRIWRAIWLHIGAVEGPGVGVTADPGELWRVLGWGSQLILRMQKRGSAKSINNLIFFLLCL